MNRKPPALADWLLRRFHVAEAIGGDLLEEFQNGRSRVWHWRQSLAALAITLAPRARNPGSRGRAVVLGWLAQLPLVLGLWALHIPPRPLNFTARTIGVAVIVLGTGFAFSLAFAERLKRASNSPGRAAFSGALAMRFGATLVEGRTTLAHLALFEIRVLVTLLLQPLIQKRLRPNK